MKNLFYILLSLVLLTGCEKFLDEDLKGSLSPDNTYTNSHGFEVGVTGLYDYARNEWNTFGGAPGVAHGAGPYEVMQLGTDIAFAGHKDNTMTPFEDYTFHAQTGYVSSFWKWAYGLIGSANLILEYSEKDVKWSNDNDKEFYQAKTRFFRAYAYRYLVYLYGDVPWVTKVERDFKDDFTRTPVDEVLDEMINDLKFAAQWLPESPDKVKQGRLSTWAAKQMLVETYLLAGKYQEAERLADTIINSGYFQLMDERFGKYREEEGDYFADMFKEYNQNRSSGNRESIWVIQLEYNTNGGGR
ncbi:MAG: RagB/SusD family nutrient uptake outer membrane protein [Odoribacter sp.]|nr:RagB/SusD family nutrient uptake outer membrane protein [Odoribacter sp.]